MCGRVQKPVNWGHSKLAKHRNVLLHIESGEFIIDIYDSAVTLKKNDIFFIPKDVLYGAHTKSGSVHTYFYFDAELEKSEEESHFGKMYKYGASIEADSVKLVIPDQAASDSSVRFHLENVLCELTRGGSVSNLKMNISFMSALAEISENYLTKNSDFIALEIEKYINKNYREKITLAKTAAHFGYTKQHIINVFKNHTGMTPTAFINDVRLKQSTLLLAEQNKSIREVALQCGFEDVNYFSRMFRKKFSKSPTGWRKSFSDI